MSPASPRFRRLAAAFGVEFGPSFRRPLFIVLALILGLTMFGLSSGHMQISSGDSTVGGTKAWITSEFAQTQSMAFLTLLYYSFFIAAVAGLTLLRDRETRVDVLLHSTPMTPGEYVWGRFLAVVASFVVLMLWQALVAAFFNHVVPNANAAEIRGPFSAASYLLPLAAIGLPFLVFYAGVSMWVGERTRSAVMVFVVPVGLLVVCGFFLWTWSPSWLPWNVNRLLQAIEPSGYRWLNETYLKVDRGVEFYNHEGVPYIGLFWVNRAWLVLLGLVAVLATQRAVARSLRGDVAPAHSAWRLKRWALRWPGSARRAAIGSGEPARSPGACSDTVPGGLDAAAPAAALAALGMRSSTPSFSKSVRQVAAAELRELRRQAGLYIFVPLILIQSLGSMLFAVGAFDTPLLMTPGMTAAAIANQISTFVCLLLLFYTVESLERERATGLAPILYATPMRLGAFLAGKAAANSVVAGLVLLAALLACAIALAIQHTVPFSIVPYVMLWGLLVVPTFLGWTAFVMAVYAGVGNRYTAYALCLGLLAFTGYRALTDRLSWAGNWPLWGVFRWSDLGFYETDRWALLLNRIMVLGAGAFCVALAVRLFGRRGADAVRVVHRLGPARFARAALRLAPAAAVPVAACVTLLFLVNRGLEGGVAKKADKDYWAKNLKTWLDAPLPDIGRMDVRVKIDPRRHWLSSEGAMTLVNGLDTTLAQVPLTGARSWQNLAWTMNGQSYEPENSARLYLFTPPQPLAPRDSVVIGWKFDGRMPGGVTKNGGNTSEFILPSGVVLTGFSPSFAPVIGFAEQVGETKDNTTEPRRHARDYWKGITRASYGATAWFPARVAVTAPDDYTSNSVGVCVRDTVANGWRTQVWETDHPVKILNIVCGRWKVRQGEGTTIFYSAAHPYNIDEMSATLDASRKWYSEWFLPYPWRELKLSEFPALASYAQGFGTNITFSENIGFLTKNDAKTDATFLVTAHEAAHQWWGNILTPANGPGGDFLSEGMAHFATLLLFEQVKGPRGRMEFAKGIEARYNDRRRANEERPMYDVDGKRRHDPTIIYDRGGWVFWMVHDFLGRERAMAAHRDFFRTWSTSRDHPALQDYVAAMRAHAPDPAAFDAFAKQWFEDKALPQYVVEEARKSKTAEGYEVRLQVHNAGTGTMPVEVAATAGERWTKPAKGARSAPSEQDPAYRESRGTVTLGAGESRELVLQCDFDPEEVVVDPDVRILQLKRKQAEAKL